MMLSKSKYIRGLKCPKSLWLYVNKKEEQVITPIQEIIFSQGTNIGELAGDFFHTGKLAVLQDEFPSKETEKRTKKFITQGEKNIYEATFIAENTIVAIDILHKNKKGKWDIYEVKSTNGIKPQHIVDVAVQYFVAKSTGIKIGEVFVLHLNKDYVRHGAIDVKKLFVAENCTQQVLELQLEIQANIPKFLKLIAKKKEPEMEISMQCQKPYTCDFLEYCQSLLPKQKIEKKQTDYSATVLEKQIRKFVKSIAYPIAYLDFETIMPAVPMWNESRPYQQITFQYSIHYQTSKKDKIVHYEYLAPCNENIDPRLALIQNMIQQTKTAKTIFVYHEAFEKTRIKELMRDFPMYQKDLQQLCDKIMDLATIFKGKNKPYTFHCLGKLWSIKKVLPLMCPDLSYEDLKISDGNTASQIFYELYFCEDQKYIQQKRNDLLAYCKMDTWAMVSIWEKLCNI